MTDKLMEMVQEFRYWRSSIPTGLLLAFLGALIILTRWPIFAQPQKWIAPAFWPLLSSISIPGWLLLALVLSALLGSWWCGFTSGFAVLWARRVVLWAPLHVNTEDWHLVRRLWTSLYVPQATVRRLKSEMAEVADYSDLETLDRPAAYKIFIREAVGPYPSSYADGPTDGELVKLWTDLRLSCGLILPLTIAIYAFPAIVEPGISGLDVWATVGSIVAFCVLLVESHIRIRRVIELSITTHLDAASLGLCARAAHGSGRTARETTIANGRTL
jgi:hypothetical protein